MGYVHCDKHDCDATNGCVPCETERVAAMTDSDVVVEVAARSGTIRDPVEDVLTKRALAISDRLRVAASNGLFQIHDNGATYWVVADTWQRAIELVKQQEDRDDFDDDPHIDYPMNARSARALNFKFEDGSTCPLWNAFELCREHEQILSCSEWP